MSDDQFTKLFKYMNQRFDALDAKIDHVRDDLTKDIRRIYDILDSHMKQREIDEQERLAMGHQLEQHSGWIKQLAAHTNATLRPDP